jgi:acyl-CoA thioesterase II
MVEEDGCYRACLSQEWEIWGPNGGYLAAIALRAAGMDAQIKRPRSFYCHFLSSPAFDWVQLTVSVLKRGRRAESFAVSMTQDGKPVLYALVKTVADAPGHEQAPPSPPEVPSPDDLSPYEQSSEPGRGRFAFWENVERRPIDLSAPAGSSPAPLREWTRFRPSACFEDPFVDAARSLILLDTYGFPASYRRHRSWDYLAPNLDTSAWFHHASPDCEWLLVDHESLLAEDGLIAVDGRVWDVDGALLATGAAQLCCVPKQ